MEKKRSKGITILGWYFIIFSIFGFLGNLYFFIGTPPLEILLKWLFLVQALGSLLLLFIGINILKLKELWRKIAICYFAYILLLIISISFYSKDIITTLLKHVLEIIIWSFIIYFITRPKVKEQFK